MEGTVGAPPQRVCPSCARISWATGPNCPYCTARFRRRQGVAPWMLALAAVLVLVVVAVMLVIAGNQLDSKLDGRVNDVNKQIDAQFDQVRADVRRELDARATPAIPTPTPFTTPAPSPESTAAPSPSPAPKSTSS